MFCVGNNFGCHFANFAIFLKHAFRMKGSNTKMEENPWHSLESSSSSLGFPRAQRRHLVNMTPKTVREMSLLHSRT